MNTNKSCISRFFFICTFLCVTISGSFAGQGKADSLFASANYFEAAIEYERCIFYESDAGRIQSLQFNKALCYKENGEYERAAENLQSIYFSNSTDTLYALVNYELALCTYLNGEAQKALWKIDEFLARSGDSNTWLSFLPLKTLCLNEQHNWNDARATLQHYFSKTAVDQEQALQLNALTDSLYQNELPKIKNPRKAENLSRFIPGSGQVYAGKAGEGMLNFLINASLLGFSVHQFYHGYYITGYVAGLGMLSKIYLGGVKRAGDLAREKNRNSLSDFNLAVNQLVIHSLQGE
ncbi:tetratricopeptide repeat protein [Roseimarinus sediminis]|uniref:tetratricopeptide repeat protein n=1 Tax=Roseimarinus sediminis TaxID=1610899 RepID=UPI003D1B8028